MIEKTHEFDNIMILRSLTKSFGLAGLRIGYSISNNATANRISASQIPWNVNGIAQRAGISALENMTTSGRCAEINQKRTRIHANSYYEKIAFVYPYTL